MPRSRRTEQSLDIRRLALIGAQARLAELQTERKAILKFFPELSRASVDGATAEPIDAKSARPSAEPTVRRRKRKISAEGRKRIAEAAKRRWADWRKQNRPSTTAR